MSQPLENEAALSYAIGLLKEKTCVVALTGAGLSTASGIPDFRSPDTGLWARLDALPDEHLQALTLRGFVDDPQVFYERFRPFLQSILSAAPNSAHYALAEMEAKGRLYCVITQNADMLHQRAGSHNVLEVHGTLAQATCISCYLTIAARLVWQKYLLDGRVPLCHACGGVLKPDVILPGEQLPIQVMQAAQTAVSACDLILVAGTSLPGGPVSALPESVHQRGSELMIINKTPTLMDAFADVVIHADVTTALPEIARCL